MAVPDVAILVPWVGGDSHREASWEWNHRRLASEHAGWEIIQGTSNAVGFSRTQALLDARRRTTAEVLVAHDADVFMDPADLLDLVEAVSDRRWSVPGTLHRLSEESSRQAMRGVDWRGLPLSQDNRQDMRPYRIHECGTVVALTSAAFDTAPPDPRFVRWGSEDDAWAAALRTLVGPPARTGVDVVHLWHPAEPRKSRAVGNDANRNLARRYQNARRSTDLMRTLIAEHAQEATNG